MPAQFAFQWMHPKPRQVHIRRASAVVKRGQDVPQLRDVVRWQPPRLAFFVEDLEATMLKRLIHSLRLFIASQLPKPPCLPSPIAASCWTVARHLSTVTISSLTPPPGFSLLGGKRLPKPTPPACWGRAQLCEGQGYSGLRDCSHPATVLPWFGSSTTFPKTARNESPPRPR